MATVVAGLVGCSSALGASLHGQFVGVATWDPVSGTLAVERDRPSSGHVQLPASGLWDLSTVPCGESCPTSWAEVRVLRLTLAEANSWMQLDRSRYAWDGANGMRFELVSPSGVAATLTLNSDVDGYQRVAGSATGLDLTGDGVDDVAVVADDWTLRMRGGTGRDVIDLRRTEATASSIDGGAGNDALIGGAATTDISGGAGNDTVNGSFAGPTASINLYGGDGNDRLIGSPHADDLSGGLGSDVLIAGAGDDHANGGDGNDRLIGGAGRDQMDGGKGNDVLVGGSGNDSLQDREGRNRLFGEAGNDVLNGGSVTGPWRWSNARSTFNCGPGRDYIAGAYKWRRSCEVIKGQ